MEDIWHSLKELLHLACGNLFFNLIRIINVLMFYVDAIPTSLMLNIIFRDIKLISNCILAVCMIILWS